jgi:hypothetical protein
MANSLDITLANNKTARENSERLGAEITELCSYIYAAEHRFLTLVREFDEQKSWQWLGFHSCAYWLNFKCSMGMNTARERVRVAHALGRLPKIDARFATGALSYSKVRAITRIADESIEDYLLMIAKHGTAYHVEKLVSKCRGVLRRRDAAAACTAYDNRQLDYYFDGDGSLVIKGRFPAEQGALIVKALEMAMEKDFGSNRAPRSAPTGDGDGEEVAPAVKNVSAETSEKPKIVPIATRRADALAQVAETFMNSEPVANATADRYQVVIHVLERSSEREPVAPQEALQQDGIHVSAETTATIAPQEALQQDDPHIKHGPYVSAETSRRIACDSSLLGIREGESGEPLSIGRKTRSIPPAMRRALRLRDGGCRFPGCTHDKFVDGHHIQHWADGGETSLDNLVLLCRHHHHLVHEGGFACEKTNDGEIFFQDQGHRPLPQWSELPAIGEDDINAWFDRKFFEEGMKPEPCAAQWGAGERMDWDLAVANFFN